MKLEVGQTVWLEKHNNAARYDKEPIETKVTKIGRKWVCVDYNDRLRFDVESGWEDGRGYTPNFRLKISLQEILDDQDINKLNRKIRDVFYMFKSDLSLDQLRRIDTIISEPKE